jgi:polyferredoxin
MGQKHRHVFSHFRFLLLLRSPRWLVAWFVVLMMMMILLSVLVVFGPFWICPCCPFLFVLLCLGKKDDERNNKHHQNSKDFEK